MMLGIGHGDLRLSIEIMLVVCVCVCSVEHRCPDTFGQGVYSIDYALKKNKQIFSMQLGTQCLSSVIVCVRVCVCLCLCVGMCVYLPGVTRESSRRTGRWPTLYMLRTL